MSDFKKLIWPIDPGESTKEMDHAMLKYFKSMSQAYNIEVQPVYVLSAHFFITGEYFQSIDSEILMKTMTKECEDYLQYFKDYVKNPVHVIDNHYSTNGMEVSLFDGFTKEYQPDFVVMASHSREGWSRGFLGSFTESFLLTSEFPVMVVGKEFDGKGDFNKALMPVELNQSSQKFLEQFLDDHRLSFLQSLTLFHKISMIDLEDISWAPTLYGLSDFNSHDIVKKAYETTQEFFEAFLDHPLSQKRLNYVISDELSSVTESIEKQLSAGDYGLLVMRSDSGTLSTNFLGSITRDVIRKSKVPVVIYPHNFPLTKTS